MDNDISYNYFLYNKRIEKRLSRRKFAKLLHVPLFRYRLVEQGYLKPSKKDIINISKNLNVDYKIYLEGANGYPTELPDKERGKLVSFLYRLIGMKWLRISLVVLATIFTLGFIGGLITSNYLKTHHDVFYTAEVLELRDRINENGKTDVSLIGSFFKEISEKTIDNENNTEKVVMISNMTNADNNSQVSNLIFEEIFWTDEYRIRLSFSSIDEEEIANYSVNYYSYVDDNTALLHVSINNNGGIKETNLVFADEQDPNIIKNVSDYLLNNDLKDDFEFLISDKLEMNVDLNSQILLPMYKSNAKTGVGTLIAGAVYIVCAIFGAIFLFAASYAYIYGVKKNSKLTVFEHGDELLGFDKQLKPLKKDIRIIPFLPETIIELIGIALVAIGSLRAVSYSSLFISYSADTIQTANELLSIQMLGMFLLYFIDFDLFMDDKRVLRNLVMYSLLFLVLYFAETKIMLATENTGSILLSQLKAFPIPNPFGSVTCYFGIMAFLFFTPKRIKTKKSLIIYRSLAIIPIIFIFVAFFISHSDVIFDKPIDNLWIKYLFTGERLPFSMLASLYLVGLFFLRLFFKKRYGETIAKRFFMGNRFIILKNLMTSIIVLGVWIFEIIFSGNASLNKIGIGINTHIILLLPILLLYHPHKGPRNLAVDYTTLFLYFVSLAYGYLLAVIIFAISLV